ncbi:MAG: hypothetical protein PHW82_12840 [Bacteroidales bacterium]|nr:hypothetical protein [Bacteroidales bacterium]
MNNSKHQYGFVHAISFICILVIVGAISYLAYNQLTTNKGSSATPNVSQDQTAISEEAAKFDHGDLTVKSVSKIECNDQYSDDVFSFDCPDGEWIVDKLSDGDVGLISTNAYEKNGSSSSAIIAIHIQIKSTKVDAKSLVDYFVSNDTIVGTVENITVDSQSGYLCHFTYGTGWYATLFTKNNTTYAIKYGSTKSFDRSINDVVINSLRVLR